MHCPLRCETVIKARQKFHTVVFDGSETTVLPLRFRLRAAGAVTMLFSTPWPLWSPVLWLCNVFFFPRLLPLSLHLVFACVLGAVSHRVGVRLAVLFLTLKLWRTLFFSALCHEPVLLSWFSRARLQRPPLSGLQKNSKRVNFFLPVNLPVRRFQFKVVYIASVTVRIASECATEPDPGVSNQGQVESLTWD